MEEEKMEMSTVCKDLPRYYRGYDMDILITKMRNQEPLTSEEEDAILEAQRIYFRIKLDNNRKRMEELGKKYENVRKPVPTLHPLASLWDNIS